MGPAALVAPDLLGERAAGLPLHYASARTLPQLRQGRSAAASTLGRRCAARWASPFAPAGRWLRLDCGHDPHRRGLMTSVGTTGAARDKGRSRPHLPTGRCWVSGRALNPRPASGRLVRPPLLQIRRRRERILGSDERRQGSCRSPVRLVRYWSSPTLDPGLGVCSRRTGSRQHRAGLPIVHASR